MTTATATVKKEDHAIVKFFKRCIVGSIYNEGESACFPWSTADLLVNGGILDQGTDFEQRIKACATLVRRMTYEQYITESNAGQPDPDAMLDTSKLSKKQVAQIKAIISQPSAD